MTVLLRLGVNAPRRLGEQVRQLDRLGLQLHPACRDALQIEQLVDQLEQLAAVAPPRSRESRAAARRGRGPGPASVASR